MENNLLLWLIPLPPLLAFFLIILFTNRQKALSHGLAVGGALLSWAGSLFIFWQALRTPGLAEEPMTASVNWLPTGATWLKIGMQVDPLTAISLFFVAWTVLTIFIYSVGYHNYGQPAGDHDIPGLPPHGASVKDSHGHTHQVPSVEPMYSRFFAFISLFACAMYLLVLSDNLLTLYIGWEIMGLCSYLLIGFWYGKPSARDAAVKAFLTTRIGDVFMLLGLAYLYSAAGTLNFREIFGDPAMMAQLTQTATGFFGLSAAGVIGLLLFIGVIGKSAQFPLHVWLPDAMEGPTPVSAMIHAATMVSAGVYLAIRIFPLISAGYETGGALTPTMMVLAIIGAFTALFAATIAVAQNDIKRVLAYSTISQLGYMIAALGIGAYAAAAFHLVTHAFFKALLFLGSGSVIHGMEHGVLHTGEHVDGQDMLNMGGLRQKMPVTFWTFLAGGLALSGFPLITAGFWSKDEILTSAVSGQFWLSFAVLALAALITAFYTMRQITLTFLGEARTRAAQYAHETPWTMTLPLVVLAVFAVTAGWVGIPEKFPLLGGLLPNWFGNFVGQMVGEGAHEGAAGHGPIALITSLVVSLGGLAAGWAVYRGYRAGAPDPMAKALGGFHSLLKEKYHIDEFYHAAFIVPARWLAETFTFRWLDQTIIDGILHAIGRFFIWLGSVFRNFFDTPVINRGGDALARGVGDFGASLKPIQSGRVQQYLVTALVVFIILAGFLFYMVVLA